MIKETFKKLQTNLTEEVIDLNMDSIEIGQMVERLNSHLSKAFRESSARETQLMDRIKTLEAKVEARKDVYSQAEIDSWNGMGQ